MLFYSTETTANRGSTLKRMNQKQYGPGAYLYKQPQGSHEFCFATGGARFIYRANTSTGPQEFSI
jgi:hypothetical protein